jgi:mannose-1-phosphate guanylyltransferase
VSTVLHVVLLVILAGGSGTRLWLMSRALHPKQYLADAFASMR